jgi:predicted  nucleic acid-binding Zn-ribbon protein
MRLLIEFFFITLLYGVGVSAYEHLFLIPKVKEKEREKSRKEILDLISERSDLKQNICFKDQRIKKLEDDLFDAKEEIQHLHERTEKLKQSVCNMIQENGKLKSKLEKSTYKVFELYKKGDDNNKLD